MWTIHNWRHGIDIMMVLRISTMHLYGNVFVSHWKILLIFVFLTFVFKSPTLVFGIQRIRFEMQILKFVSQIIKI